MPAIGSSSSSCHVDGEQQSPSSYSSSFFINSINSNDQPTASNGGDAPLSTSMPSLTRNSTSYPELRISGPAAWYYDDDEFDPLHPYNDNSHTATSLSVIVPGNPSTTTVTGVVAAAAVGVPPPPPPLHLPLIASQTALLIVDVQPQYWSQCPAVRKDFPDFPNRVQELIQTCRDPRHPATILWVYADYRYDTSPWLKQFNRLHQGKIPTEVYFDHQTGWEDFAKPQPHEPMIAKRSWSCTSQTQLLDLLQSSGVDTVLVCGLITSVCVQHSAFGVFEAGYRTILVTDACADRGRERHKAALALYGDYMYELKTVRQVQDEWQQESAVVVTTALPVPMTTTTTLSKDETMSCASTTTTALTVDDDATDSGADDDEETETAGTTTTATTTALLQRSLLSSLSSSSGGRKRVKPSSNVLFDDTDNTIITTKEQQQQQLSLPDGVYRGVA